MWTVETARLDERTINFGVCWDGIPISSRAAYELCASSEAFRSAFLDELDRAPFAAYFWETPPITVTTGTRPFEYVLTEVPQLAAAAPEAEAFRPHFRHDTDGDGIVTFRNLGGDATLVVPCPLGDHSTYAHLASFVRNAPERQKHAMLTVLGAAVASNLSDRPLWISTAGMGVYWLHVRLDSRPKYYRHAPYKTELGG